MLLREAKVVYTSSRRVDCSRRIRHACDVQGVLLEHGLADEVQECVVVLHLNARHDVLSVQEVARGSMVGVDVHPREIFRGAILQGSAAIILAHNHPSGDASPSPSDEALTRRIWEVGELVGIPVLDHIIIAGTTYTSLASSMTVFA